MPVTRRPFTLDSPSVLDSGPESWLKSIASALGIGDTPDVGGLDLSGTLAAPLMAAGKGVSRRLLAKAGGRIPEKASSGMGAAAKIPRFRSPLGTFVKHEGEWWRLGRQPQDVAQVLLEKLPQGEELAYLRDAGEAIPVLDTKTVHVDDLIKSAMQSNAVNKSRK